MTERLAALKADESEFWGRSAPKCPHCGTDYDIQRRESWHLYTEGDHDIECPSCDLEYTVQVNTSFSYNTDDQPEDS